MRTPYESSPGHIVKIWNSTEKHLGDTDAIKIASAVSQHQNWISIQLDWHQIGPLGAEKLINAIEKKHIECFCLRGNPIGDIGATHIADTLATSLFTLKSLYLNICNIGDAGAIALAKSLKINKTLKTLDLRGNNIGDEGAIALAEALRENQSLEKIFLDGNHISDNGAIALAIAIRENRRLKEIFLDRNHISDDGAKALAEAIKENKGLECISLEENRITERSAQDFLKLVKSRSQPPRAYCSRQLSLAPPPRNRFDDEDEKKEDLARPTPAPARPTPAPAPARPTPAPTPARPTLARAATAPKPNHVGTYGIWNKKPLIGGVILAVDVIANLTAYFVGGALSTFLFSPPGVILSVFIALVALRCQVVRQKGPKSQ